jgi:hypothetical protein
MQQGSIDSQDDHRIMHVEEVAQYLRKSSSWVYKNWKILGGVKLAGCLLFPSKEHLHEHLFRQGKGVAVRFHPERTKVYRELVQNEKRSAAGGGAKEGKNWEIRKRQARHPADMSFLELVNLRLDFIRAYKTASYYNDNRYLFKRVVKRWGRLEAGKITSAMVLQYILSRAKESH